MTAFMCDREVRFASELYIADAALTNPSPLHILNVSQYNSSPRFAADGSRIFYLASNGHDRAGRLIQDLYQVAPSAAPVRIADGRMLLDPERWSP
jgi:hypothetical protein